MLLCDNGVSFRKSRRWFYWRVKLRTLKRARSTGKTCSWSGRMKEQKQNLEECDIEALDNFMPSCERKTVDYEQSLFPLRDSRAKRTIEWARIVTWRGRKSPAALIRECSSIHPRINAASDLRLATLGLTHASRNSAVGYFRTHSLACSFRSTILERKERLLVV